MDKSSIPEVWDAQAIEKLYDQPLLELVFQAAEVHRQTHDPRKVQVSSLISIKTGGCPEDCAYCPQAARYHTEVEKSELLSLEVVKAIAEKSKKTGFPGYVWAQLGEMFLIMKTLKRYCKWYARSMKAM